MLLNALFDIYFGISFGFNSLQKYYNDMPEACQKILPMYHEDSLTFRRDVSIAHTEGKWASNPVHLFKGKIICLHLQLFFPANRTQ